MEVNKIACFIIWGSVLQFQWIVDIEVTGCYDTIYGGATPTSSVVL